MFEQQTFAHPADRAVKGEKKDWNQNIITKETVCCMWMLKICVWQRG